MKSIQRIKIMEWFSEHSSTMLECSKAIGVERANICRILFDMREEGLIECVGYRRDFFTGFLAMVFTAKERNSEYERK